MNNIFEASGKTVEDALNAACAAAGADLDEVEVEILEVGSKGFLGLGGKSARVRVIVQKPQAAVKSDNKEKPEKVEKPEHKSCESIPHQKDKPRHKETPDSKKSREPREFKEHKEVKQETVKTAATSPVIEEELIEPSGVFAQTAEETIVFLTPVFARMQVSPKHDSKVKEGILWISFSGMGLGALIGRRGETLNALQYLANLVVNRGKENHCRIVLDVEGYRKSREDTLRQLAKKMADQAVRSGRRLELEPMNPHERRIVHLALQDDKRVDTLSRGEEPYRRVVILKKHHNKSK